MAMTVIPVLPFWLLKSSVPAYIRPLQPTQRQLEVRVKVTRRSSAPTTTTDRPRTSHASLRQVFRRSSFVTSGRTGVPLVVTARILVIAMLVRPSPYLTASAA